MINISSVNGGATPYAGIPYRGTRSPATIAGDNEEAYRVIDARLASLSARLETREKVFAVHSGDGEWSVMTGLGQEVPVHAGSDGAWEVVV